MSYFSWCAPLTIVPLPTLSLMQRSALGSALGALMCAGVAMVHWGLTAPLLAIVCAAGAVIAVLVWSVGPPRGASGGAFRPGSATSSTGSSGAGPAAPPSPWKEQPTG
jgi:hypothetical protein